MSLVIAGDHTFAIRIAAQQLSAGRYVLPWQAATAIGSSQIWEISNQSREWRIAHAKFQSICWFLSFGHL